MPSRRNSKKDTHPLEWVRALSGPAFILGGWGVIATSFWIGVLAIYFGCLLLLLEIVFEPWIIRNVSLFTHCIIMAFCLVPAAWFTIAIVAAPAPLTIESYLMRHGNHANGTEVAGIKWDSHFTELRVTVTNPGEADYQELDLAVQPNEWAYKAVILSDHSGCDLTAIGGDVLFFSHPQNTGIETFTSTKVGDGFDVHDTLGNMFTPLATKAGYRLMCRTFPPHFTVQLIFAVVKALPKVAGVHLSEGPGTTVTALKGVESEFDLLDNRPFPSVVAVTGHYTGSLKRYAVTRDMAIKDGD